MSAVTVSPAPVTLGLDTFGDIVPGADGRPVSDPQMLRDIVEEAVLADEVGLDHFAIGEHHTAEMPMSAPDVVLASIAALTGRIRLGSGVTVLSTDDPVRVYQRYATLDGLSGGRAEVVLGRGSSTESFPLFGFNIANYDELFEEKLELWAELRREQTLTWEGKWRPPVPGMQVYPHTAGGTIPTWVGIGGNPQSVLRAARRGFNIMVAIIGGNPARFAGFRTLFERANEQFGNPPLLIGVHSPGHVAATDEQAIDEYWPFYKSQFLELRRQRGFPPITREFFEKELGPHGSLYVGSPQTVAAKIIRTMTMLGASRFDLKYGMGGPSHEVLMRNIGLFGREVAPRVRAAFPDVAEVS